MKTTFSLIFTILVSSFALIAQSDPCSRTSNFGAAEICFPKIENYQECYLDSIIKPLADATEIQMNEVLGYYITEQAFQKRDSIGLIALNDYFKIYGTKQIKDLTADKNVLVETKKGLEGTFLKKNWDLVEKEVDKIGMEIDIGVPVVINSYSLNDESFSIVMLVKYQIENMEPYTMAMTVNGLLINERMVWMAYYLNYEGVSTIEQLEKNSNKIVTDLLKANG